MILVDLVGDVVNLRLDILCALLFETQNLGLPLAKSSPAQISCCTHLLPLVALFHRPERLHNSRIHIREVGSDLFVVAIKLERAFAGFLSQLRVLSFMLLPGKG